MSLSAAITVLVPSSFPLLRQEWFTLEHSVHPSSPWKESACGMVAYSLLQATKMVASGCWRCPWNQRVYLGIAVHSPGLSLPCCFAEGFTCSQLCRKKINHICSYRQRCWRQQSQCWAEHSPLRPHALGSQDSVTEQLKMPLGTPSISPSRTCSQPCINATFSFHISDGYLGELNIPKSQDAAMQAAANEAEDMLNLVHKRRNVCFWVPGRDCSPWGHW